MTNFLKHFSDCVAFALLLTPLTALAHDQQSDQVSAIILAQAEAGDASEEKPEISDDSWISNGRYLGSWWIRNAKKYKPMPRALLCHIEASYIYSEKTGNTEQKGHKGNISVTLRKGTLTSATAYTVTKNDTTMALSTYSTSLNDQFLAERLYLALTDRISLSVGAEWERYASKYIENRMTYYGGLMGVLIDFPNFHLWISASYGYSDIEYMNEKCSRDGMPTSLQWTIMFLTVFILCRACTGSSLRLSAYRENRLVCWIWRIRITIVGKSAYPWISS